MMNWYTASLQLWSSMKLMTRSRVAMSLECFSKSICEAIFAFEMIYDKVSIDFFTNWFVLSIDLLCFAPRSGQLIGNFTLEQYQMWSIIKCSMLPRSIGCFLSKDLVLSPVLEPYSLIMSDIITINFLIELNFCFLFLSTIPGSNDLMISAKSESLWSACTGLQSKYSR